MAVSGKKIVTTAGTAVTLGDQAVNAALLVKALAANTGLVYLGNDGSGDVSSANGFELSAGDAAEFDYVHDLANLWVDAAVNGEGVCWLIVGMV